MRAWPVLAVALALFGCGEADDGIVIVLPTGDAGADGGRSETAPDPGASLDSAPPTCTPGETHCNGRCTPVMSDPMNCGGCGAMCPSGSTCSAGMCMLPPSTG